MLCVRVERGISGERQQHDALEKEINDKCAALTNMCFEDHVLWDHARSCNHVIRAGENNGRVNRACAASSTPSFLLCPVTSRSVVPISNTNITRKLILCVHCQERRR